MSPEIFPRLQHQDSNGNTRRVDVSYQLNYVEKTGRRLIPWSWRHTGVYHHRRQPSQNEKGYDFFILLHPNEDSISDKRILNGLGIFEDSRLQPGLGPNEARDQSILVHSLVLSSFICNWRWYLQHLGDRFEKYVGFSISQ